MKRAEIITALALLVIAGFVMREAIRLGPGWGEAGPRGGFFPFWLSVVLGLSSLWILFQALRHGSQLARNAFFPPGAIRQVLTVFLPMAGAFALFEVVGFYVTALVYLVFYIRLTGRQSWALTVAVGILFPTVTFLIFERWFLIPLPKGRFGEQLLPF
ncbi:MAG: tripartite tricarboxylate transporter TctB family protein [Candidatus Rokubacteria bacterium]|nr:tripartite tricarboxylate transporter TctB family protein [Candidatus Rokubacteria bacterium]